MMHQLPVLIVIVPLLGSFVIFLVCWWFRNIGYPLAVLATAICLLASIGITHAVINGGAISYWLGGWPPPWGIEYRIDHLNALMLVLVSGIGLLSAIHSKQSVKQELSRKAVLYWSLFLLMITGLLGICITGDLFNLFVLIEVASLAGYALIAMGEPRALYASFRYLIIGTIGAAFYLLGVGHLYMATGSLNMADLAQLLPGIYQSKTVLVGFTFILTGLCIKMALFPIHTWLPDAYAYAPSAASAVVAPLMTKVMVYVLLRVMFTVFRPEFSAVLLRITDVLVWWGTIAVLFGAVMALSQKDFKRMLAYIIVAEIGYIVGGIGMGNATALKGAVFHILNGAMMMACLFLVAVHVIYRTGGQRIENFKYFFRTMPCTAAIFTIGALAVIGVPPTCGFFSKWYLLLGAIEAGHWGFVFALLICTLINIGLFIRVFDQGVFTHAGGGAAPGEGSAANLQPREAPMTMLAPAFSLALLLVLVGIFNQPIMNGLIGFAVPPGF